MHAQTFRQHKPHTRFLTFLSGWEMTSSWRHKPSWGFVVYGRIPFCKWISSSSSSSSLSLSLSLSLSPSLPEAFQWFRHTSSSVEHFYASRALLAVGSKIDFLCERAYPPPPPRPPPSEKIQQQQNIRKWNCIGDDLLAGTGRYGYPLRRKRHFGTERHISLRMWQVCVRLSH